MYPILEHKHTIVNLTFHLQGDIIEQFKLETTRQGTTVPLKREYNKISTCHKHTQVSSNKNRCLYIISMYRYKLMVCQLQAGLEVYIQLSTALCCYTQGQACIVVMLHSPTGK